MYKRLLAGILFLVMNVYLMGICEGDLILGFRVESGDFKMLNSRELSQKVIFFFYDHKTSFPRNNDFKENLFLEYKALTGVEQDKIEIVQVIDCSQALMITRYFWRKSLVQNSEKYGLKIWGDWNGRLKCDYHFEDSQSYMLIVDPEGKVIYTLEGLFPNADIKEIARLVKGIISDDKVR
ncbi:MAG: YtfJ family protein [Candidatus Stygibacter australis]|nr:YtfJ family protein [Candidatus Stygibacter australis]